MGLVWREPGAPVSEIRVIESSTNRAELTDCDSGTVASRIPETRDLKIRISDQNPGIETRDPEIRVSEIRLVESSTTRAELTDCDSGTVASQIVINSRTTTSQMYETVPRRARIQGSLTCVSLNSSLDSSKQKEQDPGYPKPGTRSEIRVIESSINRAGLTDCDSGTVRSRVEIRDLKIRVWDQNPGIGTRDPEIRVSEIRVVEFSTNRAELTDCDSGTVSSRIPETRNLKPETRD